MLCTTRRPFRRWPPYSGPGLGCRVYKSRFRLIAGHHILVQGSSLSAKLEPIAAQHYRLRRSLGFRVTVPTITRAACSQRCTVPGSGYGQASVLLHLEVDVAWRHAAARGGTLARRTCATRLTLFREVEARQTHNLALLPIAEHLCLVGRGAG